MEVQGIGDRLSVLHEISSRLKHSIRIAMLAADSTLQHAEYYHSLVRIYISYPRGTGKASTWLMRCNIIDEMPI